MFALVQLMVAHQGQAAVRQGKAPHAVKVVRRQEAVIHHLTGAGDDLVGEPRGKVQHTSRVRPQGAIAPDLIEDVPALRGQGGASAQPGKGQGRCGQDQAATTGAGRNGRKGGGHDKPLQMILDDPVTDRVPNAEGRAWRSHVDLVSTWRFVRHP